MWWSKPQSKCFAVGWLLQSLLWFFPRFLKEISLSFLAHEFVPLNVMAVLSLTSTSTSAAVASRKTLDKCLV